MTSDCILSVRRGALHMPGAIYERFFDGLENVVLLRDGNNLMILPVRYQAAGGYVIKLRSSAGDRSVAAADFFRDNGIDDDVQLTLAAAWSNERAALVVMGVFN